MNEVAQLSVDTVRMKALGIIIVTLILEQNAEDAAGNVTVSQSHPLLYIVLLNLIQASDQLVYVIDNILKASLDEMKRSHEEFNSSSRYG